MKEVRRFQQLRQDDFSIVSGVGCEVAERAVLILKTNKPCVFNAIALIVSLPFSTAFLLLIYFWVPHGKVELRQIFFTSAATSLLLLMTTFAYRLALPFLSLQSSYGEIFKVMVLITWVFLLAFILILGANLSAYQILPRTWTGRQPHEPGEEKIELVDV